MFAGSPYFKSVGASELDRVPFNLAVGIIGGRGSAWSWQASLTEDVIPNTPSVDFTVDFQLSTTWGGG